MQQAQVRVRIKGTGVYVEPVRPGASAPYETMGHGRKSMAFRPSSGGPNAVLDYSADGLRNQARDLVRKDPYARAIVNTIVKHTVGTGIVPQLRHEEAKQLWLRWTDEAAANGGVDFYGLQAQCMRALVEGGECFVRLRQRRPGDMVTVPLQLQVLESEMVPMDKNETVPGGGYIRQGIEFNAIGRVVAYWMYRVHPADSGPQFADAMPVRVPADEVLHLHATFFERPGQVRGEPWLAPQLATIKELHDYLSAELERKEKAAKLVGAIRQNVPEGMNEEELAQAWGEQASINGGIGHAVIENGSFPILDPGQDIEFFEAPDVGANFPEFVAHYQRMMAAPYGLLYEQVSGDYSKGNDRLWRAAFNEFRRTCEMWQHHILAYQLCRPVWTRWLSLARLGGQLPDDPVLEAPAWVPQGWPYLNPVQDATAKKIEIRAGISSRARVVGERGESVDEIDRENADDRARAKGLGLMYDTDPAAVSGAGVTQARPSGSELPAQSDDGEAP